MLADFWWKFLRPSRKPQAASRKPQTASRKRRFLPEFDILEERVVLSGTAYQLAFLQQPAQAVAGQIMSPFSVAVEDAAGQLVTTDNSSIAIRIAGPSGLAQGTTAEPTVGGVATFNDVFIDQASPSFKFTAQDFIPNIGPINVLGALSNAFAIVPGPLAQLTSVAVPFAETAGSPFGFPVEAADAFGNGTAATLHFTSSDTAPGVNLPSDFQFQNYGPTFQTFLGVILQTPGNQTITITGTGGGAVLTWTLHVFVLGGTSTGTQQPPTLVNPGNQTNQEGDAVSLQLQGSDSDGDSLSYSEVGLPAGLGLGSSTGLVSGPVSAPPGQYPVTATVTDSAGLSASQSFVWTVTAAAANQLAFVQQPTDAIAGQTITPPVTVAVEDRFGNIVTTDSSTVSLALNNNGNNGVLNGTLTVAASGGVATFPDLFVDKSGTGYTLQASDSSLTGATSNLFNVTSQAAITFLPYQLSNPNNSIANLFAEDGEPFALPLVDLSVAVQAANGSQGLTPTGTVQFTALGPNGPIPLGIATVSLGGVATLRNLDSGLLGQPGLVVQADYSGDAFFQAANRNDGGQIAMALNADPPVTDNPVIKPNAHNLTVVVVFGSGAERTRWRDSARAFFGAGAFIITDDHSIAQLGASLAKLPKGSISHLVIGGHGNKDDGPLVGDDPNAGDRLNADELKKNPAAVQQIKKALRHNALIDLQTCCNAKGEAGKMNTQALANLLDARVRAATGFVTNWDQTDGEWIILKPKK